MANQEKHIKVFDIAPKKDGVKSVSVKIIEEKQAEQLKEQMIKEQPQQVQSQEQKQELEQITSQDQAEKEFLSKWFYKKKKDNIEGEILIKEEWIEEEKKNLPNSSLIDKKKEVVKEIIKKSKIEVNPLADIKIEEEEDEDFLKDEIKSKGTGISSKTIKYVLIVFILAMIGGGVYAALEFLPKAEIKITMKKIAWNFNNSIVASKNIGEINIANKQIPANFFSEKKNITLVYPATGKKNVEQKASGEIIIYNAYSSQAQSLVANTRFESLNGKIFRIQEKITVPGAKVENGKITPVGIKAKVVADKIGSEYNIGPTKFTIPGFKGSPKYEGFYAKSENAMSGGFVGEIAFPTDEEIKVAREKTAKDLEHSLSFSITSQIPADFKIIEKARQFIITKENVNREVNQENKYSYFMEGELTVIGFKEFDLLALLNGLAEKELGQGFKPKDQALEYKTESIDIAAGILNIAVDYKGTFWQAVDIEQFKNSILNKRETDLKAFVFSIEGVERANVSLWPFWIKRVPGNINNVKIEVE